MKKKVLYLLPIILFIFLLSGCNAEQQTFSNSITFGITLKSDGSISQTISFPSQVDQMNLSEDKKIEYINRLTLEIKKSLFFPYFYNFYTISALSQNLEYKIGGENMRYTEPTYSEEDQTIYFSFSFANSDVWSFYHPKAEEDDGMEIGKTLFMNFGKSENNLLFNETFSSNGLETTLGNHFYTILSTVQQEFCDVELSKPSFAYIYSHYSNKLHTNADVKQKINGQNEYIWTTDYANLSQEKSVEITLYSPNRAVWYAFALAGTILIMLGMWTMHYLKNRKTKEKN